MLEPNSREAKTCVPNGRGGPRPVVLASPARIQCSERVRHRFPLNAVQAAWNGVGEALRLAW
jgi:hypothetical protein